MLKSAYEATASKRLVIDLIEPALGGAHIREEAVPDKAFAVCST